MRRAEKLIKGHSSRFWGTSSRKILWLIPCLLHIPLQQLFSSTDFIGFTNLSVPVLWKSSTLFTLFKETCPYLSFLLNSSKSPSWSFSPFFSFLVSSFFRTSSTIHWQQDWKCVTSYWLSKYLDILSSSHAEGPQWYKNIFTFPFWDGAGVERKDVGFHIPKLNITGCSVWWLSFSAPCQHSWILPIAPAFTWLLTISLLKRWI